MFINDFDGTTRAAPFDVGADEFSGGGGGGGIVIPDVVHHRKQQRAA